MAYVEILTSHGLSETQWNNDIFSEYLGMVWWKNLMGTSSDAVIQVLEDLNKQPGDTIKVGLRGQMAGGSVTGNSKAKDNEGSVTFYYDSVVVDNVRTVIKIEDIPMSKKRVGFNLLQQAKEALTDKHRMNMEDRITTQLNDVTDGYRRGRYLYGAADSNYNATYATALQNIDNTADQLTTSMIDIAKRKALIPVNADAKIRPTKIKNGKNYEEWFVFVGHPYCMRDLLNNDAAFRNENLLLPPRQGTESFMFTGSSFKGNWRGVMVYEYDRLSLISSTIQVAHNFLLGAQAAAVAYAQRAKFGEEFDDLGHDVSYELHEIVGEEKLVFNRGTEEDQGVVHVFAAAVAD
jgi:N4-gp56 family major capsid protein